MSAAYDALSSGMKKMLNKLSARHSSRHSFGYSTADGETNQTGRVKNPELAVQDAVHPVIITLPGSGCKALYVNPEFTVGFEGWTDEESKPLLEYLYQHAGQPRFTCRLSWRHTEFLYFQMLFHLKYDAVQILKLYCLFIDNQCIIPIHFKFTIQCYINSKIYF